MKNAFTIDVEDYYQVEAFANVVDRKQWENFESRVERNTHSVLDLLDEHGTKGTFFVLGCVAERNPSLVREIAARGHEIGSHGFSHMMITKQTPDVFREETRRSKTILEDQSQQAVIGYRAATYSVTKRSLWALDTLQEAGFKYDSSIFPMRHDRYGIHDAAMDPGFVETPAGKRIVEFPISVAQLGKLKIPVAGGGYFRLFPYALTHWGLSRINAAGRSFVFYLHPWEVDPHQPRIERAGWMSRFRHYQNLSRCRARLSRLLGEFQFTTMKTVLTEQGLLAQR